MKTPALCGQTVSQAAFLVDQIYWFFMLLDVKYSLLNECLTHSCGSFGIPVGFPTSFLHRPLEFREYQSCQSVQK